jgi:hypothetical protein
MALDHSSRSSAPTLGTPIGQVAGNSSAKGTDVFTSFLSKLLRFNPIGKPPTKRSRICNHPGGKAGSTSYGYNHEEVDNRNLVSPHSRIYPLEYITTNWCVHYLSLTCVDVPARTPIESASANQLNFNCKVIVVMTFSLPLFAFSHPTYSRNNYNTVA